MIPCKHDPMRPYECRICYLAQTRPEYAEMWRKPVRDPAKRRCISLGVVKEQTDAAGLACNCVGKWLHECKVHGECTLDQERHGVQTCRTCPNYQVQKPSFTQHDIPKPEKVGAIGEYFNGTMIEFRGKRLLAYRTGWAGSQIHITEMNNYQPTKVHTIQNLSHKFASHGREDPRLFIHRNKLHLAYTGVVKTGDQITTHQMYAELDSNYNAVTPLSLPNITAWEKNWQFFSYCDELFAVYSIAPHKILHVVGDKYYPFTETPTPFMWTGGALRGGAPPVLYNGKWYHWFHGRVGEWAKGVYNIGVYTFENRPPFRVLQMSHDPVVVADEHKRGNTEPRVVFPGGAYINNGLWVITSGVHDRTLRVHEFRLSEVDSYLEA